MKFEIEDGKVMAIVLNNKTKVTHRRQVFFNSQPRYPYQAYFYYLDSDRFCAVCGRGGNRGMKYYIGGPPRESELNELFSQLRWKGSLAKPLETK